MADEFRGPLGAMARDTISGYEGIVMQRTQYLTGCNRIGLQKQGVKEDGTLYEQQYFDEPFVEYKDERHTPVIKPVVPREASNGGPASPTGRKPEGARR